MKTLEHYYSSQILTCGAQEFSDLTDQEKKYYKNSLGFRLWKKEQDKKACVKINKINRKHSL